MKATLIMLPQPILVSDEEIKDGESYWHTLNLKIQTAIHCSGKQTHPYPKIIAGTEGLPTLDLSLIAEEIGWVDLDKLTFQRFPMYEDKEADNWGMEFKYRTGFKMGFQEAQSLNEKKYSLSEMEGFTKWLDENWRRGKSKKGSGWFHVGDFYKQSKPIMTKDLMSKYIDSISKPQEYNVLIETELVNQIRYNGVTGSATSIQQPKITNNTIKVTKIIKPC